MNSSGPQDLKRQHGLIALRHRSIWRHWREPYVFALALSWPGFLALTSGIYLTINLLFAALYRLDPAGIGGTSGSRATFAEAFFFSVQTLGSIGYGVLHPRGLYTNLVVTVESLTGLLVVAITTGLAFARFSRSNARIRFCQRAVIHPYNGVPTLSIRVANERRNAIRDAQLKAFLAFDETSSEGHRLRRLKPLKLEREQGVAFLLVWTAMHHIDAASPLHGLSADDLQQMNAEVLVALSGVDETIERPVHAQASWPASAIAFGAYFADMLTVAPGSDQRQIQWAAFDQIFPCPLNNSSST